MGRPEHIATPDSSLSEGAEEHPAAGENS